MLSCPHRSLLIAVGFAALVLAGCGSDAAPPVGSTGADSKRPSAGGVASSDERVKDAKQGGKVSVVLENKPDRLVLSADGQWLAAADPAGRIAFVDPETLQLTGRWNLDRSLLDLKFSADQKQLLALTSAPRIRVWDLASEREVEAIQVVNQEETPPTFFCMAPMQTRIAIATDRGFRFVGLRDKQLMFGPEEQDFLVKRAAVSRLGSVAGFVAGDGVVFGVRPVQVNKATLSQAPLSVAGGDQGHTFFGLPNRKLTRQRFEIKISPAEAPPRQVTRTTIACQVEPEFLVTLNANGAFVALDRNGAAERFLQTGESQRTFRLEVAGKIRAVAASPGGAQWFVLDDDGLTRIPSPIEPVEHAISAIQTRVRLWLYLREFEKLEAFMAELRKQARLTREGKLPLLAAYESLADPANQASAASLYRAALDAWKELPAEDRVTCNILSAKRAYRQAWGVRGRGPAKTVSSSGRERFRKHLESAETLLDEVEDAGSDVELFTMRIQIATGLAHERRVVDRYAALMAEHHPNYVPFHAAVMEYLLPRWRGQPGEVVEYMGKAADKVGGDDGDALYAELYLNVRRHFPPYDAMRVLRVDYARVVRGLRRLAVTRPANELTYWSTMFLESYLAQDRKTAAEASPRVADLSGSSDANREIWKKLQANDWMQGLGYRTADQWLIAPKGKTPDASWVPHHPLNETDFAFDTDGRLLTVGLSGLHGNMEVRRWDPKTGELLGVLLEFPQSELEIGFDHSGRWLMHKSNFGVIVFNLAKGTQHGLKKAPSIFGTRVAANGKRACAMSPMGNLLGKAAPTLFVWDLEVGELPREYEIPGVTRRGDHWLSISPDGRLALVQKREEVVAIDLDTGKALESRFPAQGESWWDEDEETAVMHVSRDGAYVWNPRTGDQRLLANWKESQPTMAASRYGLACVSPDRKHVLLKSPQDGFQLWSVGSLEREAHFATSDLSGAKVAPSGRRFAIGGHAVQVFELR